MPNAENCPLRELEVAAKAAVSRRSHVRMMAVKTLLLGFTREQVAQIHSISQRTLTRWIQSFNRQGIDGLTERPRPGRPTKIRPERRDEFRDLVQHPEKADQTHWTGRKFHGYLTEQLQQEVGYRTVVRWLHDQGFRLKVPRPWPNRQDEAKRQAFMEKLQEYLADSNIDIWYLDETGIEGDPRPRRRWAQKGEKLRQPYQGTHLRMNATGMVCPRLGTFYALEFTHSDVEIFQVFLDHANQDVAAPRRRNLLIMDNASWHKGKSIRWGRFEPVYLPPYSPDLNPIERLWLLMKAEWFSNFFAKNMDDLIHRLDQALLWLIGRTSQNQKTCTIQTEL